MDAREVTLATWDAGLSRAYPGTLLRDLGKSDPQSTAAIAVLKKLDADLLVLVGIDYDYGGEALAALRQRLAAAGLAYPHALALRPNTGVPTGLDLNHDGQLGGANDAQGYGRFPGQAGIAVLSKYPLDKTQLRDFSGFLWKDLPHADLPPDMTPRAKAVQRLATTGFYDLAVAIGPTTLHLLIWAATPPVYDGPEDRNGRRNADETAFWSDLLAGKLPFRPPEKPFILIGQPNLDPNDGAGKPAALRALLANPEVQDPQPRGAPGRNDPGQKGDPALDTALLKNGSGLRLDMILPSAGLKVTASGVLWPAPTDPMSKTLAAAASYHFPVWVSISLP